jgi:hypothetical protein
MLNFTPRQYKSSSHDLAHFIGMLDLWNVPCFSKEHQEIVVATSIFTGVLEIPRPMATLYIAEKKGHQPLTGTIVLFDSTGPDERPGTIELHLEGYRFRDFNPNAMPNPIIEKHYALQDCAALARELSEVIASHWKSNWFTSVPLDQR